MLEVVQSDNSSQVYFLGKMFNNAEHWYGERYGFDIRDGAGGTGYLLRMHAVGVVFQLNSASLSKLTPERVPDEFKEFFGYNVASERIKDSAYSGIVVAIDPESVIWISDRQSRHQHTPGHEYAFAEGSIK